jgi:esterase/lipase
MLSDIPLWGQWSILGLSLGFNLWIAVQYVLGKIPTQAAIEQANKTTEQALKMADTWQHAWEISENRNEKMTEALEKIVVTGETTLKILEARPPILHEPGGKS